MHLSLEMAPILWRKVLYRPWPDRRRFSKTHWCLCDRIQGAEKMAPANNGTDGRSLVASVIPIYAGTNVLQHYSIPCTRIASVRLGDVVRGVGVESVDYSRY